MKAEEDMRTSVPTPPEGASAPARGAGDTVRQNAEELATLLDIAMSFSVTTDLPTLLQSILARSAATYEATDAAAIFIYDPDKDHLVAKASIGYEPRPLSRVRLQPGEGIVGKAFQEGRAILCSTPEEVAAHIENLRVENRVYFRREGQYALRQSKSAMCAPLTTKDRILGAIIHVSLHRAGGFSSGDLRFLQAVANQIAMAVENASLVTTAGRAQALEEADRFKDELLVSMSHQLLTPITSIRAAADLLLASTAGSNGPAVSLAKSISRNTQRLQSLVEELLDLARLQRGEASLKRDTCDLRNIVSEAAAATEPLMAEKEQSLIVDTPPSRCLVLADRGRLEHAALNLLSNACKFTPRQGHITVALHDEGEEYVVSVADDGLGIPLEEQSHIFERFYSRSRGPGRKAGTGLGLAIAKTVVEMHGGRIWVKSQIGGGSAFYFAVPKEGHNEDTGGR